MLIGVALVMKHVANYCQRRLTVLAVHFTVRGILPVVRNYLIKRSTSVIKVSLSGVFH